MVTHQGLYYLSTVSLRDLIGYPCWTSFATIDVILKLRKNNKSPSNNNDGLKISII